MTYSFYQLTNWLTGRQLNTTKFAQHEASYAFISISLFTAQSNIPLF